MKTHYHREITQKALSAFFDPAALETLIAANLGQDALPYQVGHDHFHYDSNAFDAGDAYVQALREQTLSALRAGQPQTARQTFGRLTHTVQDFYAHSNYVELWHAAHAAEAPQQIDPLDETLRRHPSLHSGKLYYPLEALSFIPALEALIVPLLPADSHARMNKDHPQRPFFDLAYHAAVKRTRLEFERLTTHLSPDLVALFTGKPAG